MSREQGDTKFFLGSTENYLGEHHGNNLGSREKIVKFQREPGVRDPPPLTESLSFMQILNYWMKKLGHWRCCNLGNVHQLLTRAFSILMWVCNNLSLLLGVSLPITVEGILIRSNKWYIIGRESMTSPHQRGCEIYDPLIHSLWNLWPPLRGMWVLWPSIRGDVETMTPPHYLQPATFKYPPTVIINNRPLLPFSQTYVMRGQLLQL